MIPGKKLSRCFTILVLLLTSLAAIAQTSVGLGGGGSMYAPAISPFDPNVMFVACDMTGLYRSTDGGATWTMLDGHNIQGSTRFSVAFDPYTSGRVLGFRQPRGLVQSTDNGASFVSLASPPLSSSDVVVAAAYTGNTDTTLLVASGSTLYGLTSGGWTTQPLPITSTQTINILKIVSVTVPGTSQHDLFFAANIFDNKQALVSSSVYKWNGSAWAAFSAGLPAGAVIADLAGGGNASKYALHVALGPNGIYRLESGATSWVPANGNLTLSATDPAFQYPLVGMAASDPDTVHVANANDCTSANVCGTAAYKGTFGSAMNWVPTLSGFQNGPNNLIPGWIEVAEPSQGWGFGFGGPAHGLAAAQAGGATVLFTNNAAVHVSTNAGTNWTEKYSKQISAGAPSLSSSWQTTGLNVTTTWNYVIHPNPSKSNIRFIPNTDIGLSRSEDGSIWTDVSPADPATGNKWSNFYQLAFEYPNGTRIWAGLSHEHDIPYESELDDAAVDARATSPNPTPAHGIVYVSSDDGKTWAPEVSAGLPNAPVVSVIYDPNARVVYASVWRNGVYKLANGATSWTAVGSFPLGTHVYQLQQDSSGSLYLSVVGSKSNGVVSAGALYKFDGTTWQSLTQTLSIPNAISVPTNFAFDPAHPGDIYLATESIQGSGIAGGGGVYKFSGGAWSNTGLTDDLTLHGSLVVYAPIFINNRLYATTVTQGTFAMVNGAWQPTVTEVPFIGTQRLVLDNGNLPLASSWTFDTAHFTAPSFTVANPVSTSSSSIGVATTGTFTINGTEQGSASGGTPATAGSGGQITITGAEQSFHSSDFVGGIGFDDGTVSVSVGSYTATVTYQKGSTAATVAAALIRVFNTDAASPVTATAVSTTGMSFTAKTTGAGTNYVVSVSSLTNEGLAHPSFSSSPTSTALTGGSNGTPGSSLFDQGTVTLTVNARPYTVSYGQGSTGATIASALANLINTDSTAAETAAASNNAVTVTAKQTAKLYVSTLGGGVQKTNPPTLAVAAVTINGAEQSLVTNPTPATAGSGGQITITGAEQSFHSSDFVGGIGFDDGTVSVSVGSYTATVTYQKGSTAATVAAALIRVFNTDAASPVTATAVSTTGMSFTAKTTGSGTNYVVSVSSVTNEGLAHPSFSAASTSTALTGGSNGQAGGTIFDQGTVTVIVSGHNYTTSYGQTSTAAGLAQILAGLINGDTPITGVTATVTGNVINLTAKTLFQLSASTTYDSAHFSGPSFPPTVTGPTLQ
jgi:phage tail sheath gpL-like